MVNKVILSTLTKWLGLKKKVHVTILLFNLHRNELTVVPCHLQGGRPTLLRLKT